MIEGRGNILLTGFELEPAERVIVDNIIRNYESKIRERIDYKKIKLRLKKSQHGKAFLHEVEGSLITEKDMMTSKATGYNLFSVLADVLEKLLNEAVHKIRTRRQK